MTELDIFLRMLLAFGLGALMGAERERFSGKDEEHGVFGGIRTFMFITLMGSLSAYISSLYFDWFIVPAFLAITSLVAIAYHGSIVHSKGRDIGMTGEVVALLAFFVGVLTMGKAPVFAIVLSILITLLLYLKNTLHGFINNLSKEEVFSTLIFAVVAFVILPFLPNQTYGPLNVLNPYKIWLMVVFISGLGYTGYVLVKVLGSDKGIGLTGLLGGMVSSTAVTMTMSNLSKKERNDSIIRMLVFGTVIANAVMFVRVVIEVYVVNQKLVSQVILPMSIMAAVALIGAGIVWFGKKGSETTKTEVVHASPLTLGPAIKFGLLYAVVLFGVKAAQLYFGNTGIYIASLVSGFVDVDAITLTMANIAGTEISEKVAVTAIVLAVMSNTIVKFGYAAMFGAKPFRNRLGIIFSLAVVAGLLVVWLG